jgi:hypothetical protein
LKPSKKVGVKGILPLGCFPLWGREGVTLLALNERKQMTEKQGFNKAGLEINKPGDCSVEPQILLKKI